MATPARKCKYEEVRWSLSCSSLTVRWAGVSAFRFPIVGVLGLVATHWTVHHHWHQVRTRALAWHTLIWCAAWAHATYQYHVNGMDTTSRSVIYSEVLFKALILLVNLLYTTIRAYAPLPQQQPKLTLTQT